MMARRAAARIRSALGLRVATVPELYTMK